MDARITPDTRFVLPNRISRLQARTAASRAKSEALRQRHEGRPLVLTTSASVNWRGGGISDPLDLTASSDPLWALDCTHGSALITSEIEAPRFEHDFRVKEHGWDLVSVPWFDASAPLAAALEYAGVDAPHVLSDTDAFGENVTDELIATRLVLSTEERQDLRELGELTGRALGLGVDAWRPGNSTDFEVAATVAAALEAEGARAVCLIVGGDERLRRLRHPLAVGEVVNDALMAVVVARRAGLHAAATRIAVRSADDSIVTLMASLDPVTDAVLAASSPGGTWGETLTALEVGYGSRGYEGAWREHFQGGPIGFNQREFEIAPKQMTSPFWDLARQPHTAIAWNPSLRGGAKSEETYLVGERLEWLTATPGWPTIEGPLGSSRSAVKVLA